jgi:hypothetical protein
VDDFSVNDGQHRANLLDFVVGNAEVVAIEHLWSAKTSSALEARIHPACNLLLLGYIDFLQAIDSTARQTGYGFCGRQPWRKAFLIHRAGHVRQWL